MWVDWVISEFPPTFTIRSPESLGNFSRYPRGTVPLASHLVAKSRAFLVSTPRCPADRTRSSQPAHSFFHTGCEPAFLSFGNYTENQFGRWHLASPERSNPRALPQRLHKNFRPQRRARCQTPFKRGLVPCQRLYGEVSLLPQTSPINRSNTLWWFQHPLRNLCICLSMHEEWRLEKLTAAPSSTKHT